VGEGVATLADFASTMLKGRREHKHL